MNIIKPEIVIPIYEKGVWSTITFKTREDFRDYLVPLFKEPGKYEFDEVSLYFNYQAEHFRTYDFYCDAPENSRDFVTYWDDQKNKCRVGAFFKSGKKVWYLPRDYYMWLNFLPIFDKLKGKFDFAEIWDTQYHIALYECLAELHYKHAAGVKKRQIAWSYFHMGKLINQLWFEEGVTLKMGASLKDYINDKGSWKFLNEYAKFLNEKTAWYRPLNPSKVLMWQQKIENVVAGRKIETGLKGTIQGVTFEKGPTVGVGGACRYFYYEEGGIAPTADQTYGFMKPALKMGMITTGLFIIGGSVGDLDQCNPLKEYVYYPEANDFYAVDSNLLDAKGTIGKTGLFIPEQWSMPPHIDKYGNSLVEEALKALDVFFTEKKKSLTPEAYQLEVSQHPRNLAEAFAHRKLSKFPQHLVTAQMQRITDKEYGYKQIELYRNSEGQIKSKLTDKLPITEFPIRKNETDKSGCILVWEEPVKDPEFGMYYASIDPVSEGKTTTSDSLCSIYVMKNAVEVTRVKTNKPTENFIEGEKIVACWTGRFDDLNKTHERLELIIEWYNAWTIVENNISLFIQYMIGEHKQKHLVPKSMIVFLKDLKANANVFQEYGWKNTGRLFKDHLLSYCIEYLTEELDKVVLEDGKVLKIHYGVERIPDMMLLKEMQAYEEGLNVDRLVAFSALVAFSRIQQANRGLKKRIEEPDKKLQKSQDFSKLRQSPFVHMGKSGKSSPMRPNRNAFKNLR